MSTFRPLCTAALLAIAVLAKAQTSSPSPSPAASTPIEGASDYLDEVRVVQVARPGASPTYAIVLDDLARLHPAVVRGTGAGAQVDQAGLAALLLALAKDLRAQNLHLNNQLAHVIDDKAELERQVHALNLRFEALELRVDAAAAPAVRAPRATAARQ